MVNMARTLVKHGANVKSIRSGCAVGYSRNERELNVK